MSKQTELVWIAEARKHIGLSEIVGTKSHNTTNHKNPTIQKFNQCVEKICNKRASIEKSKQKFKSHIKNINNTK